MERPRKKQRTDGPEPQARHRLIVGIDYGTTYTGISYVTSNKSPLEDIGVITSWPGKDGDWKTPTRIAYASENPKITQNHNLWGFSVKPNMVSCSWTKLLFDVDATTQEYDDPTLRTAITEGHLRLPPTFTAQRVASDFLGNVYKHLEAELVMQFGQQVFDSTPMDCWLTVPAVWSDKAQAITKAAALTAGFAARAGDTMSVIPEPEAAAIAVINDMARQKSLDRIKAGETILICDCGGGTVDITSYTIIQIDPVPAFEEVCVGVGGKCGATSIDRALQKLMGDWFGAAWDDHDQRFKGPGSFFMNTWEIAKRQFDPNGSMEIQELGPVNLKGVSESKRYDEDEQMVKLGKDDIAKIFEPTVQEVLKLVSRQKAMIEKEGKSLDRLALVGGFGESKHLFSSLKHWCKLNGGIELRRPKSPQAAIVQGAALRGLTGVAPRKRRCRRHYGIKLSQSFREGIDPERMAFRDSYSKRKMCMNRMTWCFEKGADVTETSVHRETFYDNQRVNESISSGTVKLYSCAAETAPDYHGEGVEKVGTVKYLLEFDPAKLRQRNGCVEVEAEIEIIFGSTTGTLEVKVINSGKVKGQASIVY